MAMYTPCPMVGAFPTTHGSGRTLYVPKVDGYKRYGLSLSMNLVMYGRCPKTEHSSGVPTPTVRIIILQIVLSRDMVTMVTTMTYTYVD